jgi:hypothetical protein
MQNDERPTVYRLGTRPSVSSLMLASFLLPGLGHAVLGSWTAALGWFAWTTMLVVAFLVFPPIAIGCYVGCGFRAGMSCRAILQAYDRWESGTQSLRQL